jgi:hypothetical protein
MESGRSDVTLDIVADWFRYLAERLQGVPAHFVFNMDEIGHQEFADAPIKTAFIPADATDKQVYYPVSRTGKRITLIACIAADGSYLKPALIIARKTFDDELVDYGYTPEKLDIYSQDKSFIETTIFEVWFQDTLKKRGAAGLAPVLRGGRSPPWVIVFNSKSVGCKPFKS